MNHYKNLSIITVSLYLIGILATLIYLFNLPSQLATAIPSIGNKLELADGVFYNTYIIIAAELLLGVVSIIFLFIANQKKEKVNVVYVDKYASGKEKESKEEKETETTTQINHEIESKLNSIKSVLGSQKELKEQLDNALSVLCNDVEACQGAVFLKKEKEGKRFVQLCSSYAYNLADSATLEYEFGEGLTGQAAKEGKFVKIDAVPDGYIKIFSGLGKSSPSHLVFVPLQQEGETIGVMEIAAFREFTSREEELLKKVSPILSEKIAGKEATNPKSKKS
jgi:putative methionine-R-sulfoxide reductase with GAF domain